MFTDWSRSGTPDLRVSNDREYYEGGQEQMWRISPGKAAGPLQRGRGLEVLRIWGMGIASYDLDFDGFPEYFLTSMADNKLQTLANVPPQDGSAPSPDYKDIAYAKGVTAHRPFMGEDLKPSTAWHTQFEDVNNDGLVDLFIAKGNVAEMPDFAMKDPNNLLVQGADGKFTEAADKAGVASTLVSRGGALADFNLDGLHRSPGGEPLGERTDLAQHDGSGGRKRHHAALAQDGAEREWHRRLHGGEDGGPSMRREVIVGGGHASGQAGWIHLGLGDAEDAEVRVQVARQWLERRPRRSRPTASSHSTGKNAEPRPWTPPR
jgi:enediyne biosynthesis protein E4